MVLLPLLGHLSLFDGQAIQSHHIEINAQTVPHTMSISLTFIAPRPTPLCGGGASSVAFHCLLGTLVIGGILGNGWGRFSLYAPHPFWPFSGWASLWVPALPEYGP